MGTEHWAFRVEIEPRTGALIRARTTYDDLDHMGDMQGMPETSKPRVKINRVVTIEPR